MLTIHYHTLGLSPDCATGDLRRRYLELVRQYPPETHPERFSKIHEAYEKLKDPLESIPDILFSFSTNDSMEHVIANVLEEIKKERLPTEMLLKMGVE